MVEKPIMRCDMDLFEVLSRLNNKEEFAEFFDDLCTHQEIDNMQQRIECAQLLLKGETYNEIIEQTDISSATLSRVSRCIRYGSGGYSRLLKDMMDASEQTDSAQDAAD